MTQEDVEWRPGLPVGDEAFNGGGGGGTKRGGMSTSSAGDGATYHFALKKIKTADGSMGAVDGVAFTVPGTLPAGAQFPLRVAAVALDGTHFVATALALAWTGKKRK